MPAVKSTKFAPGERVRVRRDCVVDGLPKEVPSYYCGKRGTISNEPPMFNYEIGVEIDNDGLAFFLEDELERL